MRDNLQELIVKHGLSDCSPEVLNKVNELCRDVVQTGWFAGTNHANDVMDGVEDRHPDRRRFMKNFLGNDEKTSIHNQSL